jgi:hypothetical protein
MRRTITIVVLLLSMIALPLRAQEERVRLTGVVMDDEGKPMGGQVVTATAEGAVPVRSLTDRDGNFQLLLRPGIWTLNVSRLGGRPFITREIRLRQGDSKEIELALGVTYEKIKRAERPRTQTADSGRREPPEALQSVRFSAANLDDTGKRAAVELSLLTDSVIQLARQRIAGQLANNKFNASFWLVDQLSGDRESGSELQVDSGDQGQWRNDRFRLGLDMGKNNWLGKVLAENDLMVGVPVNVTIGLRQDRLASLLESARNNTASVASQGNNRAAPNAPWTDLRVDDNNAGFEGFNADGNTGIDLGFSEQSERGAALSLRSLFDELRDHIGSLYRPMREAYTSEVPEDAVDAFTQNANFGVEKTFLDGLRGTVQYTYSEANGLDIQSVNLHFEDLQDFERFLETGLRHDLSTTVEAAFGATGTRVRINYRLFLADVEQDSTFNDRLSQLLGDYSRLDLALSQRIDFGLLSNARISLNVAVNNLLNNRRNFSFLNDDTDLLEAQRTYIGGIRIEF